jgi:hypothetical protein
MLPLLNSRQERSVIYTTCNDLRNDESQFCIYFRMSVGSVDARLRLIYNDILRSDTNARRCVPLGRVASCSLAVIQFNCPYVFASYTVLVRYP